MSDAYYKPLGLPEITGAVNTPEAGLARLFVKPGGLLCVKTSDTVEHVLVSEASLTDQIANLQAQIDALNAGTDFWTELITTADVSNSSSVTLANVSQLSISVIAGKKYYLEYTLVATSTNSKRGLALTIGSSAAVGELSAVASVIVGNDGATASYAGTITSFGDVVIGNAAATANARFVNTIRGIFICTTSGSIFPQFRVETGSNETLRIKAGSVILSREF